ncbi:hypothetical protein CDO47_15580 [Pseudomonas aeruginosa]|nr:hypothetical protein CDO47_15580 [Pseudomonas aeruginosa]
MSFLWYSMGWASSGAISTASLIFQIRAKTATALQTMRAVAGGLEDSDIQALAGYLGSLGP